MRYRVCVAGGESEAVDGARAMGLVLVSCTTYGDTPDTTITEGTVWASLFSDRIARWHAKTDSIPSDDYRPIPAGCLLVSRVFGGAR
jgi:hypothetical protein